MSPHEAALVPECVAALIDRLCAEARLGAAPVYGLLLRENVLDALGCSFPRFCDALGASGCEAMASAFVTEHRAKRPQFHHIATEFVQFAQQQAQLPRRLLCLLEYEWTLLAAEIDPSRVPGTPFAIRPNAAELPLAANPTLHIIALPFEAERFEVTDAGTPDEDSHVYAIYRSSRHSVLVKPLYRADCLLLAGIQHTGRFDPSVLLPWLSGQDPNAIAAAWLEQALDHDLIHISEQPTPGDPT